MAEEPDGRVCIDVAGVGYDVLTPVGTLGRATSARGEVQLTIHTHVREDSLELFGFASDVDRRVFRLLLQVPNVGPKTALGVMSALPIEELARAIREGNLARLGKVPGIGKKTAERVVLELRGKLNEFSLEATAAVVDVPAPEGDAAKLMLALTNMGYRPPEAARAVKAVEAELGTRSLSELLRSALSQLTP